MATDYLVVWPKVAVTVNNKRTILARGDALPKGVAAEHAQLLASFGAVAVVGATMPGAEPPSPAGSGAVEVPEDFNPDEPGAHSVKVVQAFLDTASDEDAERVLVAEEADKNRKGVVEYEPSGSGDES